MCPYRIGKSATYSLIRNGRSVIQKVRLHIPLFLQVSSPGSLQLFGARGPLQDVRPAVKQLIRFYVQHGYDQQQLHAFEAKTLAKLDRLRLPLESKNPNSAHHLCFVMRDVVAAYPVSFLSFHP